MTTADARTRMQRKDSAEGQPTTATSGVQAKVWPNSNDSMVCAAGQLLRQGELSRGIRYLVAGSVTG